MTTYLTDTSRFHREAVIGALLELLGYDAGSPEEQSKFKDLTVKCLIKVTKSLDDDIKTDRATRALNTVSTCTVYPASRTPHPAPARHISIVGQAAFSRRASQ